MDLHVLFEEAPRSYALDLVSHGELPAETLALACLKYLSHEEVRDLLRENFLAPGDLPERGDARR